MKRYWGKGGTAPDILNLGTRQGLVVSFTLQSLNPGTHWIAGWVGFSRSGRRGEEKESLSCLEVNRTLIMQPKPKEICYKKKVLIF